jgi:hypothetical protein
MLARTRASKRRQIVVLPAAPSSLIQFGGPTLDECDDLLSSSGMSTERRLAVVATDDGRFAYQVLLVCGEPRTLLTDGARYLTPADAAQAGYEAV